MARRHRRSTDVNRAFLNGLFYGNPRGPSKSPLDVLLQPINRFNAPKPISDPGRKLFNAISLPANQVAGAPGGLTPASQLSYAPGMKRLDFGESPTSVGAGSVNPAPGIMSAARHPVKGKAGGGGGHGGPNLAEMARQALISAYAPQFGAIDQAIKDTRHDAGRQRHQINRQGNRAEGDLAYLYGALGRDVGATKRSGDRSYNATRNQINSSFNSLRGSTNATYKKVANGIADEMARMGITDPNATSGLKEDNAFVNAFSKEDQTNQRSNNRQSRNEYDANMGRMRHDTIASGNAAVGGARSQTRSQLNDLSTALLGSLNQLRSQKAQLSGQEASALAQQRLAVIQDRMHNRSALRLMRQQQRAAASNPTNILDTQMKQAQLAKLLGLLPDSSSNATSMGRTPMSDAQSFLSTQGASGNIQHTAGMQNLLDYVTGGHTFAEGTGKTSYSWQKKDEPNIWAAMQRTGQRNKWSTQEMNYLHQALRIALGI